MVCIALDIERTFDVAAWEAFVREVQDGEDESDRLFYSVQQSKVINYNACQRLPLLSPILAASCRA